MGLGVTQARGIYQWRPEATFFFVEFLPLPAVPIFVSSISLRWDEGCAEQGEISRWIEHVTFLWYNPRGHSERSRTRRKVDCETLTDSDRELCRANRWSTHDVGKRFKAVEEGNEVTSAVWCRYSTYVSHGPEDTGLQSMPGCEEKANWGVPLLG